MDDDALLSLPAEIRKSIAQLPPNVVAAATLELSARAYSIHASTHQLVLANRELPAYRLVGREADTFRRLSQRAKAFADAGYELLEVGCELLRKHRAPIPEFELEWHFAVEALLAGVGEPSWLGPSKGGMDLRRHVRHLDGRLEPQHLASVEATTYEQVAWWIAMVELPLALSGRQAHDDFYLSQLYTKRRESAAMAKKLLRAAQLIGASDPSLELRALVMDLVSSDGRNRKLTVERLRTFVHDQRSAEVRYIAGTLLGYRLESDGDLTGAETAYRAAVEAMPRAQRAQIALAALMAIRGEGQQAAAIVDRLLEVPPAVDPLDIYGREAQTQWTARLSGIRRGAGVTR